VHYFLSHGFSFFGNLLIVYIYQAIITLLIMTDIEEKGINWWIALLLHGYLQCGDHSQLTVTGPFWTELSILQWLR